MLLRYKICIILLAVLISFSVYGCATSNDDIEIEVENVELNVSSLDLLVGDNYLLQPIVSPQNATYKSVIWSSSDENVVTVTEGYVIAISEGEALITAKTLNNLTATCLITVSLGNEVSEIYFAEENVICEIGDSMQLLPTVLPVDAYDKTLTWSTSNENVVAVLNGVITAIASGSATVTAKTVNGLSANCLVTVELKTVEAESIALNYNSYSCNVGDTFILTETVLPNNATDKNVSWQSTNETVAIVSEGVVVTVNSGVANIVAITSNGKIASCSVIVSSTAIDDDESVDEPTDGVLVEKIVFNLTEKECYIGNSFDIIAEIFPENATDKLLTWSSSNESVAVVDCGTVTTLDVGETKIIAKSSNGIIAECEVSVVNYKEFDARFESEIFIYDGQAKSLTLENIPIGTTISYENNDNTDIGEYTVRAKLEKEGYVSSEIEATMKIVAPNYEISYVLNCDNATNNNPNEFATFSELELMPASCETLDFIGWYTDADFVTVIKSIPYDCFENLTLYAKWENRYTLNGSTIVSISSYAKENIKTITIPSFVDGIQITAIGDKVFKNSVVENVTIPSTIESIGREAFATNTLREINFVKNGNLKSIGKSAFSDASIKSIVIPSSVQNIGECAFECCYELENVIFEDGSYLEEITSYLFYECVKLEEIYIPESVSAIGDGAFYGCVSLKNVYIYRKLQDIGDLNEEFIKYLN